MLQLVPTQAPLLPMLLAASLAWGCSTSEQTLELPTATAELRGIERIVVATGTVEPEGEVEVRPRIAGIVEEILVEPGDEVRDGQILVEIERELIEAQVAEARARVQASEVRLRYAEIAMRRAAKLQRQGASSDSAHDEARSLHETSIAMLAQSRAGLETLAVQLRHASVRAPSDGRVLDVPIEIGAAVSPVTSVTGGTVLLSLASTDRLHLKGSVDENEIAKVALEQPARIRTEAYGDRIFLGRVRKIAPVGQRIQNVTYFEVEIEIVDEDRHLLKPRMSGDADIVTETISEALVVPETALRYAGEQIYVDVVPDDPQPDASERTEERHDVQIGVVDGDVVQILSGLEPGDRVSLQ
jgi:HlyD family secretion protein